MPPRRLSLEDLTAARLACEQEGATYRDLGARYGCAPSTMMKLLRSVGVVSRPRRRTKVRQASIVQIDWTERRRQRQLDEQLCRETERLIAQYDRQRAARRARAARGR